MIFNIQAGQEQKKRMSKARMERLGVAVLIGVSFYFWGAAIASLVAVLSNFGHLRKSKCDWTTPTF